jgi:hypothetical protein
MCNEKNDNSVEVQFQPKCTLECYEAQRAFQLIVEDDLGEAIRGLRKTRRPEARCIVTEVARLPPQRAD